MIQLTQSKFNLHSVIEVIKFTTFELCIFKYQFHSETTFGIHFVL